MGQMLGIQTTPQVERKTDVVMNERMNKKFMFGKAIWVLAYAYYFILSVNTAYSTLNS